MSNRVLVRFAVVVIACMLTTSSTWAQGTCANPGSPREAAIDPCTTPDTVAGSTSGAPRLERNYDFNAQAGGNYTFTFCSGGGTATYDTALSIWNQSGTTLQVCNDDFCGLRSELNWVAPTTATYTLRVGGFSTSSQGSYTLAYSSDIACAGGGGGPAVPASSTWSLIAAAALIMLVAAGRLGRSS